MNWWDTANLFLLPFLLDSSGFSTWHFTSKTSPLCSFRGWKADLQRQEAQPKPLPSFPSLSVTTSWSSSCFRSIHHFNHNIRHFSATKIWSSFPSPTPRNPESWLIGHLGWLFFRILSVAHVHQVHLGVSHHGSIIRPESLLKGDVSCKKPWRKYSITQKTRWFMKITCF